jgi:hypothetical protein
MPGQDTPAFTSNRYDEEGFMVCPEHGERRSGWRSRNRGDDFAMSPLEMERRKMFGKAVPIKKPLKLKVSAPDQRDNRDPLKMGDAVKSALAEIRAGSNGHTN